MQDFREIAFRLYRCHTTGIRQAYNSISQTEFDSSPDSIILCISFPAVSSEDFTSGQAYRKRSFQYKAGGKIRTSPVSICTESKAARRKRTRQGPMFFRESASALSFSLPVDSLFFIRFSLERKGISKFSSRIICFVL
jgi:hypothetical protein